MPSGVPIRTTSTELGPGVPAPRGPEPHFLTVHKSPRDSAFETPIDGADAPTGQAKGQVEHSVAPGRARPAPGSAGLLGLGLALPLLPLDARPAGHLAVVRERTRDRRHEEATKDLAPLAELVGPLLEAAATARRSVRPAPVEHPPRQRLLLLERPERRPQRVLESRVLRREERPRRVGVADTAAEPQPALL